MAVNPKTDHRLPAWLSKHYVNLINAALAIFVGGTVAAPVLMKLGWDQAGKLLYQIYGKFCHQFAYRSWFLFGSQAYYPKTGSRGLIGYEQAFGFSTNDPYAARVVIGNATAGYKIAICQRDLAMYAAILLFGIVFSISQKRIRRVNFWIWLFVGVLPLAADGISQLLGGGFGINGWLGMRESTPLLRSITGSLFGALSAWYIYPSLEHIHQTQQNKCEQQEQRGKIGDS
jgi:uncharacterized membrane protein